MFWRVTPPTTSGRWSWSNRWRRTQSLWSRRWWATAPTETATPDGPSPRPDGNSWRRSPQGAGAPSFPKEDFRIDLEVMSCVCPAGQKTQKVVSISSGDRYGAPGAPLRAFRFDAVVCDGCPLRSSCVRARLGKGRLVMIHPQEALLQEARAFQQSEAFAPYRKLRQAAEHRLARLVQLGARQARYFGRTKTLFQLLMAATVANLTLVARRGGLMRDRNHPKTDNSILSRVLIVICGSFTALSCDPRFPNHTRNLGFRPHF